MPTQGQCSIESSLLKETNQLARETAQRVGSMTKRLEDHLVECDGNRSAIALLSERIGEMGANLGINDAKIDSIAKRVGSVLAESLDPVRKEQIAMKRRVATLRNIGAGIAVVVIAASTIYVEAKGHLQEVARKEVSK